MFSTFIQKMINNEKSICVIYRCYANGGKAWEKQSGKPVESEFLLDNVEALAAGESGYDICLGSGNVTCSTGEKVEYVLRPFSLD